MCVALGGRLAEEIINGKDNVTTGANDTRATGDRATGQLDFLFHMDMGLQKMARLKHLQRPVAPCC